MNSFMEKKPNVKHLHMFGGTCYTIKDKQNLEMLKAKNDIEVFLRYSNNSRTCWIYNLRTSKVMESISVVIDDSSATKFVESEDNDVFGDQGSSKNVTDKVEIPFTYIDPPKTFKDEEKDE